MASLSLATVAIIASIASACLGGLVSILKLIDRKRQRSKGTPVMKGSEAGLVYTGRERTAPLMSSQAVEPVARLRDVADDMDTGDALDFAGRKLHSYLNRIACWCRMSHSAMVYRDGLRRLWVAEVVEKFSIERSGWWFKINLGGFQLVPIEDYVRNFPGQLYWAKVAKEYDKPALFNRIKAGKAIEASVNWKYGWKGVFFQLKAKTPFVRVVTYLRTWKDIDKAWDKNSPPFCSWAVSTWATIAGQDPTPCLAPQLTTPAEIERSKLWSTPIALLP